MGGLHPIMALRSFVGREPETTPSGPYVSTSPVLDPLAAESLYPWGSAR